MTYVLVTIYVVTTIFAIVMSYNEQKRTGNRTFLFNILSYIACVVWPVTLAAVLISVQIKTT